MLRNRRNLVLFAATLAAVVVFAAPGSGQPGPAGIDPLPLLGAADPEMDADGRRARPASRARRGATARCR